jgi:hypothetical protein
MALLSGKWYSPPLAFPGDATIVWTRLFNATEGPPFRATFDGSLYTFQPVNSAGESIATPIPWWMVVDWRAP